jgi:cell division protein FtsW
MTCIAIGIIISVTKKEEEIAEELDEREQRKIALEKLIDKQLEDDNNENDVHGEEENEDYSITETAKNPMNAVKYK